MPKQTILLKNIAISILGLIIACVLLFISEAIMAHSGSFGDFHNPDHTPIHFVGSGKPLLYLVMGDSTAAGRGADYDHSIAMETARHLAKSNSITMINLGISGAKLIDLVHDQLPEAIKLKPDIVLISAGANDITNFTSDNKIESTLNTLLDELKRSNPNVRIVLTGSAELGSVPRFAQPLRWLAGIETERANRVIERVGQAQGATWAPLALKTGFLFKRDPSLFAQDQFHPNDRGYATWIPVLDTALDQAK